MTNAQTGTISTTTTDLPANTMTATPQAPPTAPAPDQGSTAGAQPNASQTPPPEPDRRYTQDDIDRVVSERLNRQKAQLAREAEEARLKEEQRWQQLAQTHESRIKELEPLVQTLEAAIKARDDILVKTVRAETKDWPAEAKALIPQDGDALAQMEAVDKARPLVAKLNEQGAGGGAAGRIPGNAPGPRPAGEPNKTLVERELERLRSTGVYGNRR